MSTWSQSVSLQFTCIFSHLSSNITCKRRKKLHQDRTSKTYQILFVQIVGKTTCFIVVLFKELRKGKRSEANTWCVESVVTCCFGWGIVFFIHLYQALLIDPEMEKNGRKRENTCGYHLWRRWCEKPSKANSEHLERSTTGNINFTRSAPVGGKERLSLP